METTQGPTCSSFEYVLNRKAVRQHVKNFTQIADLLLVLPEGEMDTTCSPVLRASLHTALPTKPLPPNTSNLGGPAGACTTADRHAAALETHKLVQLGSSRSRCYRYAAAQCTSCCSVLLQVAGSGGKTLS